MVILMPVSSLQEVGADGTMYDPRTYPKYDASKHSLFDVHRMLQHIQRRFELYWDPAQYLRIDEKIIEFQSRHKGKLRITFKDAGNGFQAEAVFYRGYTYYFIYCDDDIPDSKHYLFATSERFICIFKCLNT